MNILHREKYQAILFAYGQAFNVVQIVQSVKSWNIFSMKKLSDLLYMSFLLQSNYDTSWARIEIYITTCGCFTWYPVLILQGRLAIYEGKRAEPETSSTQTDILIR